MKPAVFSSVSSYIPRHVARPYPKPAIGVESAQGCALLRAAVGCIFRPAGERGPRRVAVVRRDPCRRTPYIARTAALPAVDAERDEKPGAARPAAAGAPPHAAGASAR